MNRMYLALALLFSGTSAVFAAKSPSQLPWNELLPWLENNVVKMEQKLPGFRKDVIDVGCATLRDEKVKNACVAAYEAVIAEIVTQIKLQRALIAADGFEKPQQRDKLVKIISIQALNKERDQTDQRIKEIGEFFFPQKQGAQR